MKRMRTRRKCWSWGMLVVPQCGRGQLYGLRRSPLVHTAGRTEDISSGCGLGAGGWRGPAVTRRPAGAHLVGSSVWWRRGAAVSTF